MKNTGIWIDKEKAYLMIIEANEETFLKIESHLENYNVYGGSGSKTKWGPQDVVQDRKYLEREKQQLKNYFKEIVLHLKDADSIVIFGPAETYLKFHKEIKNEHRLIASKIKDVKNVDSMTLNQVKALIRDYFLKI